MQGCGGHIGARWFKVAAQDDHDVCTVAIGQRCMPTGCMRRWYRRDWVSPWRSLCVLRRAFVCAVTFCRFGVLCEGARQVRFQRRGSEAQKVGDEILTSDCRLEEQDGEINPQ